MQRGSAGAPARRHRRKLAIAGSVLAAAALVLAGCSSSGGSDTKSGPGTDANLNASGFPSATPKKGGSATMVLASVGARFDPATQQIYAFTEAPVMSAVFGVLGYQEAGKVALTMSFLKSLTPSKDFKTWTATLKPNIKFSDGTPLNAAAIKYNIERDAQPATGSVFESVAKGLKMNVTSDLTLEVVLPKPNTQFGAIFIQSFGCVGSPTAEKSEGSDFGTKPVGAGPFKIQNVTAGQSITLVPNPYYKNFAAGEPYLDKLTFQFIADYPHQLQALQGGSAQMMLASGQTAVNQMKGAGDVRTRAFQSVGGGNFLFNTQKGIFKDPRARHAINLALDRTTAASTFAAGTPAATNLFPKSSPYFDASKDFAKQDKAKAQQLFNQLASEGTPVDFNLVTSSSFPDAVNAANSLQAQLAGYKNVKITIKGEPTAQELDDERSGNFDMTPGGIYVATPIPGAVQFFHTGGTLNYSRWSNATADAAMDDMYSTTSQAQIKKDWGIVQDQINKDIPVYFANVGALAFSATKNLTNLTLIGYGFIPLFGGLGYAS